MCWRLSSSAPDADLLHRVAELLLDGAEVLDGDCCDAEEVARQRWHEQLDVPVSDGDPLEERVDRWQRVLERFRSRRAAPRTGP